MAAGGLKCPQLLPLDPVLNRGRIDPQILLISKVVKIDRRAIVIINRLKDLKFAI